MAMKFKVLMGNGKVRRGGGWQWQYGELRSKAMARLCREQRWKGSEA